MLNFFKSKTDAEKLADEIKSLADEWIRGNGYGPSLKSKVERMIDDGIRAFVFDYVRQNLSQEILAKVAQEVMEKADVKAIFDEIVKGRIQDYLRRV